MWAGWRHSCPQGQHLVARARMRHEPVSLSLWLCAYPHLPHSSGTRADCTRTATCATLDSLADHTFLLAQCQSPLYFLLVRWHALWWGRHLPFLLELEETMVTDSRQGAPVPLASLLVQCPNGERVRLSTSCSKVLGLLYLNGLSVSVAQRFPQPWPWCLFAATEQWLEEKQLPCESNSRRPDFLFWPLRAHIPTGTIIKNEIKIYNTNPTPQKLIHMEISKNPQGIKKKKTPVYTRKTQTRIGKKGFLKFSFCVQVCTHAMVWMWESEDSLLGIPTLENLVLGIELRS